MNDLFMSGDAKLYELDGSEQWALAATVSLAGSYLRQAHCLSFDPGGEPWVCGSDSLNHLVAGQWQSYTLPYQGHMFSDPPNSVATDAAGNIWVGTDGNGLEVRDTSGNWQGFTAANSGIDSTTVSVFPMGGQGTVWADTGSQLFRLGNQQVHPQPDRLITGYELAAIMGFVGLLLLLSAIPFSLRGCATMIGVGLATLVLNFVGTFALARLVGALPLPDGARLSVIAVLVVGANLLVLGRNLLGRRWAIASGLVGGIVIALGLLLLILLVAAGGWGV
jgi:hypothetical protein